jgi:PAS domain S-box-containing protein
MHNDFFISCVVQKEIYYKGSYKVIIWDFFVLKCLEDFLMSEKPTYEELERKVKELEKVADDRRRRSKVFLASDQEKEAILNNLMEHVIHQDTEMRILWANRAACESANLSYEEIVGRYCYEIWPKRSDPCSDCPVISAMETGKPQVIEKSTPDGKYWLIWGYPFREKNGDIEGGIEVTLEITEQKQAEEAIRESEKRFRSIIEVTEAGYFFIDKDGIFQDVNEAWLRMHHYSSSDEVIGQHFSLTQIDYDMEAANKIVKKLLEGEPLPTGEFSRRCKDGSIGYHTFSVSPVAHGREIIGLEGFIIDITDKKELETRLRQAHKMEAIGTLAGGIAHDFNNMLGIILGNTELAMDDIPEWNSARLNLEEIKTASLRAKDVVRQLLSFARKTDLKRKPVKINPIVTGALKLLRSSIPTSIEIRSNISKDSGIILADPIQISQILINLCTNAAYAMEKEGGILEIGLENVTLDESIAQSYKSAPGRYIKLTVDDTGHGIDPEIKNRIFDPYFTTREVGKGSGMGLAVVQGIVMNHDGIISVNSEVGKGTTFNVFFPIVKREPIPEITIDGDIPTGKEVILFIDDEESLVKMGRQRLEHLGYQVESATSPLEALELFRSNPHQFDLVVTDLTMPKMTGDRLLKEILAIRPEIPVILCTGFSEKIDGEKAKEIGATGYLEKPHEKRELAKIVRKVLDGKLSKFCI